MSSGEHNQNGPEFDNTQVFPAQELTPDQDATQAIPIIQSGIPGPQPGPTAEQPRHRGRILLAGIGIGASLAVTAVIGYGAAKHKLEQDAERINATWNVPPAATPSETESPSPSDTPSPTASPTPEASASPAESAPVASQDPNAALPTVTPPPAASVAPVPPPVPPASASAAPQPPASAAPVPSASAAPAPSAAAPAACEQISVPDDEFGRYYHDNCAAAELIAQSSGVPAADLLAATSLVSDFGQSELAKNANNPFRIVADAAWTGQTYTHVPAAQEQSQGVPTKLYRVYATVPEGVTGYLDQWRASAAGAACTEQVWSCILNGSGIVDQNPIADLQEMAARVNKFNDIATP